MDLEFRGRAALVTGGASGIGRETARRLAAEGAAVLVADVDEEGAAAAAEELRGAGARAESVGLDVRDHAACRRAVEGARDAFGSLDVLVAAAGITRERFFLETSPDEWTDVLDVNIRGVLNCCHAAAPVMCEQRRGAIVNLGSEAGKVGEKRMVLYSATKGAVIAFSKALAVEVGRDGVRVNAVCPGVTRTPMTAHYGEEQLEKAARLYPLRRLGEPADVADAVCFLASERAGWITGQAVSVSGGFGRS